MFLLRTLFWLGLLLILLPLGRAESTADREAAAHGDTISPGEALSAAYATVNDLSTFCSRNPDTCAVGAAAFSAVEARAKDGVRILYDWATGTPEPTSRARLPRPVPDQGTISWDDDDAMLVTGSVRHAGNSRKPSKNTLRLEDVIPEWGGPSRGTRA